MPITPQQLLQIVPNAGQVAGIFVPAGAALGLDLLAHPEMLQRPDTAALSAAQFWSVNGLNALADAGNFSDIGSVINTGKRGHVPVGAANRAAIYQRALRVLI